MRKFSRMTALALVLALLFTLVSVPAVLADPADIAPVSNAGDVGKVTNLKVTVSGTTATLTWDAAANAEGYNVTRATKAGGPYSSQKFVYTTKTDNMNLVAGTTYYYVIKPFKTVDGTRVYGTSSDEKSITVGGGSTPTPPPSGTVGQVTGLTLTASGNVIKLTWKAAANATGYNIKRSESKTGTYTSQKLVTGTSAENFSGILPGHTYWFKILPYKVVDGTRVYGTASEAKSITISASSLVGAVTGLKATKNGATVQLSWRAATGALYYEVRRATSENGTYKAIKSTSGLSAEDKITATGSYYYQVYGYVIDSTNTKVYGNPSAKVLVSFSAPTTIGVISTITGQPEGDTAVKLMWTTAKNANRYTVYASKDKGKTWSAVKTVDNATTAVVGVGNVGGKYMFKVLPSYALGGTDQIKGSFSKEVTVEVAGASVAKPTGVKAVAKDTKTVSVTWSKTKNATGYHLVRSTSQSSGYKTVKSLEGTSYTDSVSSIGTYYYKVRGYVTDLDGKKIYGPYSNPVKVTVTLNKISSVTLTPAEKTMTVSWSAVSGADGYQAKLSEDGKTWSKSKTVTGSTSAKFTSLTPGKLYYFRVRPFQSDSSGKHYGSYSSIYSMRTLLVNAEITSIKMSAIDTVVLKWAEDTVSEMTGYQVYRKSATEDWKALPTTHIKKSGSTYETYDDTVVPGVQYSYCVTKFLVVDESKYSSKVGQKAKSITSGVGKATINSARGVSSSEGMLINWKDIQDVDEWEVQYSTDIASGYVTLATVNEKNFSDYQAGKIRENGVSLKTTSLANGVAYYVRVRAKVTSNGTAYYGAWSNALLASTPKITMTDVTSTKKSMGGADLNVVNSGDLYLTLPSTASYLLNMESGDPALTVTLESGSSTEVKPGYTVEVSYSYGGTAKKSTASSAFTLTVVYNGYKYSITAGHDGSSAWRYAP